MAGDAGTQFLRQGDGCRQGRVLGNHHELLAAVAIQVVAEAGVAANQVGHFQQHLVAGDVPVHVVDLLEIVDIQDQQARRGIAAQEDGGHVVELAVLRPPVAGAGQRVQVGHIPQHPLLAPVGQGKGVGQQNGHRQGQPDPGEVQQGQLPPQDSQEAQGKTRAQDHGVAGIEHEERHHQGRVGPEHLLDSQQQGSHQGGGYKTQRQEHPRRAHPAAEVDEDEQQCHDEHDQHLQIGHGPLGFAQAHINEGNQRNRDHATEPQQQKLLDRALLRSEHGALEHGHPSGYHWIVPNLPARPIIGRQPNGPAAVAGRRGGMLLSLVRVFRVVQPGAGCFRVYLHFSPEKSRNGARQAMRCWPARRRGLQSPRTTNRIPL